MTHNTPKSVAEALVREAATGAVSYIDAEDADERFIGYGAMGVPFESGHYLALRHMVASSVGPAYRAIWHRDPNGRWTIYTTVAPELSCPRYFGAAATSAEQVPAIDLRWSSDHGVEVTLPGVLRWRLELSASPATRMMSGMAGSMPDSAWARDAVLAPMGPMAGVMLGSGRIRLRGTTPNEQHFKAAPLNVWRVTGGRARLGDDDLGRLAPLPEQTRMADLWLPQRGIFFAGRFRFTATPGTASADTTAELHRRPVTRG
ncbi:hypothetical protein GCM10027568_02710 [Humibacter soli]